jgi:2,4-dienoyl-CoA reductase (NADPH2)
LHLGSRVSAGDINDGDFDHVIVATGVEPRIPSIEGVDHPKVVDYAQLLSGQVEAGHSVAVIGSGGVGFDVCEYLAVENAGESLTVGQFLAEWGVDDQLAGRGGLADARLSPASRELFLLQRKPGKARGVGVTSGWVRNAELARRGVSMMSGCEYLKIDDEGLHLNTAEGSDVLSVDTVVLCAGQDACDELVQGLEIPHQVIGGALDPAKLDAVHAIAAGAEAALALAR